MSVLLIAHNTFREATRDRVLSGVVAAGFVLLVVTQVLSPLALGEGLRLTVDLGLSGISLLGLLVILMVGSSLVAKEIERRTVFNLLSRPLSRPAYLVGKWVGLSGALWLVAGTLGLGLCALLWIRGATTSTPAVLQGAYMAGLELSVMTSLAVMFSALSTPVLSALYTLGFFVVGSWSNDLRGFAAQFPSALSSLMQVTANLVPNLPLFNTRSLAASGHLASGEHLIMATLYALVYCACVLCLGAAAFETRDFK